MAEIGNDALVQAAAEIVKKTPEQYDYNDACPDQLSSSHSTPKVRLNNILNENYKQKEQYCEPNLVIPNLKVVNKAKL